MIYWDIVLRKKVKGWIAIIVLIVLTSILAWVISAKAAGGIPAIGLKIFTAPAKCVLDPGDPPPGTCLASCPVCGMIPGCAFLYETQAKQMGPKATRILKNGLGLCTYVSKPPKSGTFRPGGQCLGQVLGKGPHYLFNFGCTK